MEVSKEFASGIWFLYQTIVNLAEMEPGVSRVHLCVDKKQTLLDSVVVTMDDGSLNFIKDGVVDNAVPF